jgi:hypothetical protein
MHSRESHGRLWNRKEGRCDSWQPQKPEEPSGRPGKECTVREEVHSQEGHGKPWKAMEVCGRRRRSI